MKRPLAAIATITIALATATVAQTPAHSSPDSAPLFAYTRAADGSYGYDSTRPVETYPRSGEQVQIPTTYTQDNRQLRSSWVATIANINFGKPTSAHDFRTRYDTLLNSFDSWNMNAIIFQVSPLLDAYYPSTERPWSEFLTGRQGNDPDYDPLEYMVEEAHKRGMEYHAWLNPYRVTNTKLSAPSTLAALGLSAEQARALTVPDYVTALTRAGILDEHNYAARHPEEVLMFDEKLFLDPGKPSAQQHVVSTVTDIVTRYDVDAIHFDDYFYPYRIGSTYFGTAGEDRATFETYGLAEGRYPDSTAGIESWRRDNITALIAQVKGALDAHNSTAGTAVQLGISPFGIWEHHANNPLGSHTPVTSSQTYSGSIFADTRAWVRNEMVDYIAPQIYWAFDTAAAPYAELARWWNDVADGTDVSVYIGHAQYKYVQNGASDPAWMNPDEIAHQMSFNQALPHVEGSIIYNIGELTPSDLSLVPSDKRAAHAAKNDAITRLRNPYFAQPSLVPARPSFTAVPIPGSPLDARVDTDTGTLTWRSAMPNQTRLFAIYRGDGSAESIIATPGSLVDTVWSGAQSNFTYDTTGDTGDSTRGTGGSTWVVTALNAASVESPPTIASEGNGATSSPTETITPGSSPQPSETAATSGDAHATPNTLATTGGGEGVASALAGLCALLAGIGIIMLSRRERNLHNGLKY